MVKEVNHSQVKDETERNGKVAVMPPTKFHGPAPPMKSTKCPTAPQTKIKTMFPPVAQQEGIPDAQSKAPVVETSSKMKGCLRHTK